MTIRIGIAGTHSTGKSTLAEALGRAFAARGLKVRRIADLATRARDLGFPILHDHTFDSTLWIMTRGISELLEASLAADVVIVDRPALDAIGYLDAALEHRGETLPRAERRHLLDLARFDSSAYKVLCKTVLDPGIPLGPDRDSDQKFRSAADRHIDAVFGLIRIQPTLVRAGPGFVEELVSGLQLPHI